MEKKTELNSLHVLILVAAYIADIFIFFGTEWRGISFIYIVMLVIVFLPPLVLALVYLDKLYQKLAAKFIKADAADGARQRAILKGALVAVLVLLIFGVFMLYRGITVGSPLRNAEGLLAEGKYDEAIEMYKGLERERSLNLHDEIGAAVAAKASALLEQDDVSGAVEVLTEGSYHYYDLNDSAELRRQAAALIQSNDALYQLLFSPGKCIPIGSYYKDSYPEQKNTWYILERDANHVLLICASSNIENWMRTDMDGKNWEDCHLRTRLNQFLYSNMFSESEQAAIQLTTVKNTRHDGNAVVPGDNTEDYLFLLSKEEVEQHRELLAMDEWSIVHNWWTRTVADEEEVKGNHSSTDTVKCVGYMLEVVRKGSSISLSASNPNYDTFNRVEILPCMWVDIDLLLKSWE